MSDQGPRPITVLIAALGGEGGGVLTNWIVNAAEASGYKLQTTSIPGVAQRTGATTYYIEIFPVKLADLGGREPVLSLYPAAGDIDLMVASEIVEAGRAVQSGFVTPDRTQLIASTNRVYAIAERSAMADGRFDQALLMRAAAARSRAALLDDFSALAKGNGTSLNAILCGLIAKSGVLPFPAAAFEDAIRAQGIAVDANLRGFKLGLDYVAPVQAPVTADGKRPTGLTVADLEARARAEFPEPAHEFAVEGVRRLTDYQDAKYAVLYLDRLATVHDAEKAAGGDGPLTRETARHMALWMSYEDIIRVAQLKAHPDRYRRVLADIRAKPGEPVVVTEFFKPGIDEFCSILPPGLARRVLGIAERRGWIDKVYLGMHVKTTTVWGFGRIWLLTKLRGWRPKTYRFDVERIAVEEWLGLIRAAAAKDLALAAEIAECARLIKGYGDTYNRGVANWRRIRDAVVGPALSGALPAGRAADAVCNARVAALADPEGHRLGDVLASVSALSRGRMAEAAE